MTSYPEFFERFAIPASEEHRGYREADWANGANDMFVPPSIEVSYDPSDRSRRQIPPRDEDTRPHPVTHAPDLIARYVPWHLHPDEWGIYFHERTFWQYVHDLHDDAKKAASSRGPNFTTVARIAFETVLEHEYTHFEGELLGTQLEAVSRSPWYADYLNQNYKELNAFGSPLEEAIATAREIELARSSRMSAAILGALERSADNAPAGYSRWRWVIDPREQVTAVAGLQAIISQQALATPFELESTSEERVQVPIRWVATDISNPILPPGVSKSAGITTVGQLEAWLRHVGLESRTRKSGGDHKDIWDPKADRRVSGYDSGGGRKSKELYDPQPSNIARDLGFASRSKLLEAIRTMGDWPVMSA